MNSEHHILPAISLLAAIALSSCAVAPAPEIVWHEGEAGPDGLACHTIIIRNASSLDDDWNIWFSQFPTGVAVTDDSEAGVEEFQANLHRIWSKDGLCRDSIVVRYTDAPLKRHAWAPEGFVLQARGKQVKLDVKYDFLPVDPVPPETSECFIPSSFEMIPGLKQVLLTDSSNPVLCHPDTANIFVGKQPEGKPAGWYRIKVSDTVVMEYADEDGRYYEMNTLGKLIDASADGTVQETVIEDWPDLQYRGFMLDVARNFTTKDNVLRLIDILARYKVNYLHLHLADDEGWRFAVNGIDELTSVGAFHALPVQDKDGKWTEPHALQPSYDGCADPADLTSIANGFYTRADFIEILRYAAEHHIKVVPEVDTPGHSRAAIKSMIAYEKRTGDASMRLSDPDDQSEYYTAQGYTDDALCVALPSVYTFIGRIIDEFKSIYAEAGVELPAVHLGGDEVASGVWGGSPVCKAFMEENGMAAPADLRSYFIRKIADIALEKGVKLAGWQEIVQGIDPQTEEALRKVLFFVNCWSSGDNDNLALSMANQDWPVIISDARYTYADQAYNDSKLEKAHSWAAYIDEQTAWNVPIPQGNDNIKGIQVQLFTETVRSFDDVTYDVFPKMIGIFDRGWNVAPNRDYSVFHAVVKNREYPYFDKAGIIYREGSDCLK